MSAGRIPAHDDTYFLVDPLDGTKEFIRGGNDYTVNIGLIAKGVPISALFISLRSTGCGLGWSGHGAFVEEGGRAKGSIHCRPLGEQRAAVASKSHSTSDRRLSRRGNRPLRPCVGRLVAEILHRRGRAGGYLSAPVADQRMGHGGRTCRLACGGRAGRWARRRAAEIWQEGIPQPGFCATAGWEAPPIGPFMEPFAGGGELPEASSVRTMGTRSHDPIFGQRHPVKHLHFGPNCRDLQAKPASFGWKTAVGRQAQQQLLGLLRVRLSARHTNGPGPRIGQWTLRAMG